MAVEREKKGKNSQTKKIRWSLQPIDGRSKIKWIAIHKRDIRITTEATNAQLNSDQFALD